MINNFCRLNLNNKLCLLNLYIMFFYIFINCASAKLPLIPPESEWRTFKGSFSMQYPAFIKYKKEFGVDSSPGTFTGPSIIIYYDYGWYGRETPQKRNDYLNFIITDDTLNGYPVKIAKYTHGSKFCATTYFKAVHPPNGLTITAHCTTQEALDLALRIFNTVIMY